MFFSNISFLNGLRYGNMQLGSVAVEEKLKKPDTTWEDLLEEDELIQELKNQNKKLLKFFSKDKVKTLVDYITKEPTEDDHRKGHKYPFVSSELLNCDDNQITSYFYLTEPELWGLDEELKQKEISLERAVEVNSSRPIISGSASAKPLEMSEHDNLNMENDEEEGKGLLAKENENENEEEFHEIKEDSNNDKVNADDKEKKDEDSNKLGDIKNQVNIEKKEEQEEDVKEVQTSPTKQNENKTDTEKQSETTNEGQSEETQPTIVNQEEPSPVFKGDPNRIVLLDHLFSFVETEKELNYVLVGYFSRFLSIIINKKPKVIINYLFTVRKDILSRWVYHSYRKCISDLLVKIISSSSTTTPTAQPGMMGSQEGTISEPNQYFPVQCEIIDNLFNEIKIIGQKDNEKLTNILTLLTEISENRLFLVYITQNEKLIQSLLNNLNIDTNDKSATATTKSNYMEIITYLNTLLTYSEKEGLPLPKYEISFGNDDIVEQEWSETPIIHTPLSKSIFSLFENLIKNFGKSPQESSDQSKEKETTFSGKVIPLGGHRIKIVEWLAGWFPYLKNISSTYDEILIKSKFFDVAFTYLLNHEWNNLYQLSLLSVFKSYWKEASSHLKLSTYLFETFQLLSVINKVMTNAETEANQFKYQSNNTTSHGYIPFLISLSYKINTIIGGTPLLIASRSREGSMSFINRSEQGNPDMMSMFSAQSSNVNRASNDNNSQKNSLTRKGIVCEAMEKYLDDDWAEFFKTNMAEHIILYEKKLCDQSNKNDLEDMTGSGNWGEAKDPNEGDTNLNPFPSKDENFFDMNEGDMVNMNSDNFNWTEFEFTDDLKERTSKDNKDNDLVVDELEMVKDYNNVNYWMPANKNTQMLEDALKDWNLDNE